MMSLKFIKCIDRSIYFFLMSNYDLPNNSNCTKAQIDLTCKLVYIHFIQVQSHDIRKYKKINTVQRNLK